MGLDCVGVVIWWLSYIELQVVEQYKEREKKIENLNAEVSHSCEVLFVIGICSLVSR